MTDAASHGHFLRTLDGWRAVAISMVLLSHAFTVESARDSGGHLLNFLTFRLGTLGVMLFFAISGFLICTRLLVEQDEAGAISLRSFYARRFFRIIPAAYAYLAVIAALAVAGIVAVPWQDIAAAAFFLSNYIVAKAWFTGHFWSLALEEHFYLLWPPLLVRFGRRAALWIAAALVGIAVLFRHQTLATHSPGMDLPGYTQLRLDAFMLPCILAILMRDRRFADRFRRVMRPPIWLSLLALMTVGIGVGASVPAWREPQRLFQAAVLPVLIATTVMSPDQWLGRLLEARPLQWLGIVSYSVYLWQQLIFGFAPTSLHGRILAFPILIASILTLAGLSRRWIEVPMIAAGRQVVAKRAAYRNAASPRKDAATHRTEESLKKQAVK